MITAERLATVRQEAIREAAARPPKGEMAGGDGRLTMRVPLAAYLNAKANEGAEVLTEAGKGYWDDMQRLYPESRVAYVPGKVTVGPGGCHVSGAKVLTRFGRATRVVYRRGEWL
jgi:hypothetical protein